MSMLPQDNHLLPVVSIHCDRFDLSSELLRAIGPFIGWWEIKKFVSHLISDFTDGYEHLLDDELSVEGDSEFFDVDRRFCEHLSENHRNEFPGLTGDWYYQVFRAKLLSLRIPVQLARQYKCAFMARMYELQRFVRAVMSVCSSKGRADLHQATLDASVADSWNAVLALVEPWIMSGKISEEEVMIEYYAQEG